MIVNREEIILTLLISLNKGNCSYRGSKVCEAILQYNELVDKGIIKDKSEEQS